MYQTHSPLYYQLASCINPDALYRQLAERKHRRTGGSLASSCISISCSLDISATAAKISRIIVPGSENLVLAERISNASLQPVSSAISQPGWPGVCSSNQKCSSAAGGGNGGWIENEEINTKSRRKCRIMRKKM
jgi:hypothetical protein